MPSYRRAFIPGGSFFFTVVTYQRRAFLTSPQARDILREAISQVQRSFPFELEAICLLPDHLHCIWSLPDGDGDFSTRWKNIKSLFSRRTLKFNCIPADISASMQSKGEVGQGFSMQSGRYDWSYYLSRDSGSGDWLITNYGEG